MSLKDRFDKFIDYFTEDGEETTNYQTQQEETVSPAISSSKELPAPAQSGSAKDANITRLHARQQELFKPVVALITWTEPAMSWLEI